MAAKLKLTKASVEKCEVGADKRQVIFWDTEIRGLGLRVGPSTKTYIFQRDLPGRRTRRMTIGRYPTWSPEEARKEARSLAVRMDKGEDPAATKRARAARGVTLRQALEMHLTRLRAKDASPRTIETLTAEIPRYLGDWLDRPLAEISRDECRRRHHRLTERSGPYAANRALRHLRTLYNTGARVHDLPGRSPTVAVDWNRQRRRREPIPWADLPLWHERVLELAPVRRDFQVFALLTGLRSHDARTVRWEHVDLDAATVHRPKPKGGIDRAFTVPLSKRCVELLRARRVENKTEFDALGGDHGWVFPCVVLRERHRVVTFMQEPSVHRELREAGKVRRVRWLPSPHRLRDTYASAAHESRVPLLDLKLLMNHTLPSSSDVTEGYVRPSVEYLRESQERVSAFLLARIEKHDTDHA